MTKATNCCLEQEIMSTVFDKWDGHVPREDSKPNPSVVYTILGVGPNENSIEAIALWITERPLPVAGNPGAITLSQATNIHQCIDFVHRECEVVKNLPHREVLLNQMVIYDLRCYFGLK